VVGGVEVVARYRSAAAESEVGGDLYEVVDHRDGVRLIVGDVRGKGLEAVRVAARTVGAFRSVAEDPDLSLLDVVAAVDRSISRELGDEDFVTAVFAELVRGELRVANCGHPAPVLVPVNGAVVELNASRPSTPLGLQPQPALDEHAFSAGTRVLFFSDGLLEARDNEGQFFPLEQHSRLLSGGKLASSVDELLGKLDEFAGRLTDDLVVLALQPVEGPRAAVEEACPGAGAPIRWDGPGERIGLGRDERTLVRARHVVRERLCSAGLERLADDASLLTYELVANVLHHTSGTATLVVRVQDEQVRVEVHDESAVKPVAGLLDAAAISGRGLTLVQHLASRWGVEMRPEQSGDGKAVWFELGQRCGAGAGLSEEQLLDLWGEQGKDLWDDPQKPSLAAGPPSLQPSRPQPAAGPASATLSRERRRRVLLPDVPSALLIASRAHVEDLLREMALVAAGSARTTRPDRLPSHDDPLNALARRLTRLAAEVNELRTGLRAHAVAAVENGLDVCTVELAVPLALLPKLVEYRRALDEADEYCCRGRLLVPACDPEPRAFRRWLLDAVIGELTAAPDRTP
jgi:hypothetical protein